MLPKSFFANSIIRMIVFFSNMKCIYNFMIGQSFLIKNVALISEFDWNAMNLYFEMRLQFVEIRDYLRSFLDYSSRQLAAHLNATAKRHS